LRRLHAEFIEARPGVCSSSFDGLRTTAEFAGRHSNTVLSLAALGLDPRVEARLAACGSSFDRLRTTAEYEARDGVGGRLL
jgi:hypothetical protein